MAKANLPFPSQVLSWHKLTLALSSFLLAISLTARAATNFVAFGGINSTFRPDTLTINVGDTVIWTNAGGPHTVTGAGAEPLCGAASVSACTNTFTTAGSFSYVCNFHFFSGMTGLIVVNGDSAAVPVLTNTLRLTNGFLTFTVLNTADRTNIIQTSTNLASSNNWVPIATLVPNTNRYDFTDSNSPSFNLRFYRVLLP
jgi:plastocyanin